MIIRLLSKRTPPRANFTFTSNTRNIEQSYAASHFRIKILHVNNLYIYLYIIYMKTKVDWIVNLINSVDSKIL